MNPKQSQKSNALKGGSRLSLAPLDFEAAVAAAMATGKPPKAKRKKAVKRRAKK